MRYYILNHESRTSKHNNSEYFLVNICDEDLNEYYTYVYPQHHSAKIHNSDDWLALLRDERGIVLTGLTTKKTKKPSQGQLINADSIKKAGIDQIYDTKADMFDHLHNLLNPIHPFWE